MYSALCGHSSFTELPAVLEWFFFLKQALLYPAMEAFWWTGFFKSLVLNHFVVSLTIFPR